MPMVPVVTGLSQFPGVSMQGIRMDWIYGMRVNSTKYLEEVQTTQHPVQTRFDIRTSKA